MRLLQLKNNGEFSLTKHLIQKIPPYAILSHTWGVDNQEVTFEDLAEGSGITKAGYRKIQFCADQAAHDGLQYFWVDTCCIKKSSHSELSEAINSMFQWYRNAAICYVYLSDVLINNNNQNNLSAQSWETAFRNSRWFTRGWTLQELIAPPLVVFFSSEGKRLGDKKSLERPVQEITRLPIKALKGSTLVEFSVVERMSWAEQRQTSREEDKAYSLLGIFNVSMPLIYGEGRDNAMRRLQKEIDFQFSQTSPSPSAIIPFRRDPDFVERPVLSHIFERATEPGVRIGLVGLGGVGKSQLAIECAYRVRDTDPQTWVFWVHASSMSRFEESYKIIAERLRLTERNEPKSDVLGIVHNWLSDEANGRWMMVVDNADDADVLFEPRNEGISQNTAGSTYNSLSKYLPSSTNGLIMITSRSDEVVRRLEVFSEDVFEVGPMEVNEAITLLSKKLNKESRVTSPDDIFNLVKQLEGMPLAITQAAAYINQSAPHMTVSKYMQLLENHDREQEYTLLQKDIRDPRRDRQASNSIIKTLHVTFEYLRRTRDSAAQLLALMSLFNREAIPDYLLQGRYLETENSLIDFEDDVGALRAYSLIGVGVNGDIFNMHRLVQLSIRKWLEMHAELQKWQERYIDILEAEFPIGNYDDWMVCAALFPHVEAAVAYQPVGAEYLAKWATILFRASWYATESGRYSEAKQMARKSLSIREKVLGEDHPDTLISVGNLAMVLRYQGQYEAAEEMNRQALEGKEKVLGSEHPETLSSISGLALVLQDQTQYEAAEKLNRRAMEVYEKVLGPEHPLTLTSLSNLALVLQYQGQYEAAEEISRQALEGQEKVLGMVHPSTLTSVDNLALLLQDQGQYEAAEEMHQRALHGYEKVLGREHPKTLTSTHNFALVLQNQGQYEAAEEMHQRALHGYEKVLGPEHPKTLASIHNLALVLQGRGQYEAAEKMNRRVLEYRERALGKEHPDTLTSMNGLARVLSRQSKYDEAEEMHRQTLRLRKQRLGEAHLDTLRSTSDLADLLNQRGKYEQAEAIGREALMLTETCLGKQNPGHVKRDLEHLLAEISTMLTTLKAKLERKPPTEVRVFSDSGYGSGMKLTPGNSIIDNQNRAPEKSSMNSSLQESEPHSETEYKLNDELLPKFRSSEDIRSLVSDTDDIQSRDPTGLSSNELIARRHIATLFAYHETLTPLYEDALLRIGKERFVRNFRRLLKRYCIDLRDQARTKIEQTTADLLRTRWVRTDVAIRIVDKVKPETQEAFLLQQADDSDLKTKLPLIEQWIRNQEKSKRLSDATSTEDSRETSDASQNKEDATSESEYDSSSDDDDYDDGDNDSKYEKDKKEGHLSRIIEMEGFLMDGDPFRALSLTLMSFLLPVSSGSLTRTLMSLPTNCIWFSDQEDHSILNKIKLFLETQTEDDWIWWPLRPVMRTLKKNETRVHWRCHCGTHMWKEIPRSHATIYKSLLASRGSPLEGSHLCAIRKREMSNSVPGSAISKPNSLYLSGQASGTQKSGTQSSDTQASSHTTPQSQKQAIVPSAFEASGLSKSHIISQQIKNAPGSIEIDMSGVSVPERFVLFVTLGKLRTLGLAQIDQHEHPSDTSFLHDIHKQYRDLRGFWRYWFSIWKFRYCDFVKFKKFRPNRISLSGQGLPKDGLYDYVLVPPDAEFPPIDPHEFELALAPCQKICVLSLLHDCVENHVGDSIMARIPKRKIRLDVKTSTIEYAWGIKAEHNVSVVRMTAYHFLIFAGTMLFWMFWQIRHPDDVQTAAVPITTIATLLSLFWTTTGVLKVFKNADRRDT